MHFMIIPMPFGNLAVPSDQTRIGLRSFSWEVLIGRYKSCFRKPFLENIKYAELLEIDGLGCEIGLCTCAEDYHHRDWLMLK